VEVRNYGAPKDQAYIALGTDFGRVLTFSRSVFNIVGIVTGCVVLCTGRKSKKVQKLTVQAIKKWLSKGVSAFKMARPANLLKTQLKTTA
jgi:hypothetical protein